MHSHKYIYKCSTLSLLLLSSSSLKQVVPPLKCVYNVCFRRNICFFSDISYKKEIFHIVHVTMESSREEYQSICCLKASNRFCFLFKIIPSSIYFQKIILFFNTYLLQGDQVHLLHQSMFVSSRNFILVVILCKSNQSL